MHVPTAQNMCRREGDFKMFDKNSEFTIKVLCNHYEPEMKDSPYFWCIIQDGANYGSGWSKTDLDAFMAAKKHVEKM